MNDARFSDLTRRDFLRWLGIGTGAAVATGGSPLRLFAAADPDQNPLAGSPTRDWEKVYRDQYRYDSAFDWVCSPNDTHACRVRAYVRNGIVVRLGSTYDYQKYADLYGNHASINWNPRQCAKGYTFHRVLYGPYRLRHPIVRRGWKAWADAGFPELTPELKSKYLFDARGQDEFVQISWEDAFDMIARALAAIAKRYSGERRRQASPHPGLPARDGEGHGWRRHAHDQDARRHGPPRRDRQVRHVSAQQLARAPRRPDPRRRPRRGARRPQLVELYLAR
jgi:nitrate reductase / nitrite oxidoreductase, alpha subunit